MLSEPFTSAHMLDRSEQFISYALGGTICKQMKSPACLAKACYTCSLTYHVVRVW